MGKLMQLNIIIPMHSQMWLYYIGMILMKHTRNSIPKSTSLY